MISATQHEQTFKIWLDSHAGILNQLSRAYAPESADADELYQEMMVQLWRSVPRFANQAKPSTWIYRVCLNTGLTWQRSSRRREARVVPTPEPIDTAVSTDANPADREEKGDLMDRLMTAVRGLPSAQRSLIVLALDDLSYREIAEITGMTENHVGVALTRARQTLAQKLEKLTHEF